jgi:hypothetical protein
MKGAQRRHFAHQATEKIRHHLSLDVVILYELIFVHLLLENDLHQSNSSFQPAAHRKAELTRHAQKRSQQRGLGEDQIPVIKAFGEAEHDGRGGIRYLMTGKAMTRLIRALGRNQCIDGLAGAYAVISIDDDKVITVGHRYF